MLTKLQMYANTVNYFLRSQYQHSDWQVPLVSQRDVGPVSKPEFKSLLADYSADSVFVHVGLSDVNSAFGNESYDFLVDTLDEHFGSVMAPGFTPSFRSTGVYHKQFSKPEYGMFARLFLEDADYRTDDAIHSILVKGTYRFDEYDHHDTFSRDGCWEKFDRENVLYVNIGTPWIISTQLHYLEHFFDVPYVEAPEFPGIIYYDKSRYDSVTQSNNTYLQPTKWNRSKIESYLESQNVLSSYTLNGLNIRFFRSNDLRQALEPMVTADPYYFVK